MANNVTSPLIAYLRANEGDQGSLEEQGERIRSWANRQGISKLTWIVDEPSADEHYEQRPGLMAALQLLRSGRAAGVVITGRDRLASGAAAREVLLAEIEELGGTVFSTEITDQEFLGSPPSKDRQLIREAFSAFDRYETWRKAVQLNSARVRKALGGGYAYGRPPYGFKSEGGRLHPDPEEQTLIARVVALREAGMSYRQIGTRLDKEGFVPKAGRSWHPETVRRLVSRESAK